MSKPIIKIHDTETNEIIEREMNDAEYEQWQADVAADIKRTEAEAEIAAKRQALLAKLGITEEEARLLLGGN